MSKLLESAKAAVATIAAVYEFVDRVEAAGGTGSIAGVAACHTMIQSLKKNRARCQTLVVEPLLEAMKEET